MTWRLDAKTKRKYEAAARLNLTDKLRDTGWAGLCAKDTGRIGACLRHLNPKRE